MTVCTRFFIYISLVLSAKLLLTRTQGGADIVFILDGSTSVGPSNFFNVSLKFVEEVADSVGLSSQGNRVAVVQFAKQGCIEVDFVDNIVSLKQGLSQIVYHWGNTNTTGGLLVANDLWANKGRSHRCAKIGILLIDGICTLDCGRLASAAEDSARDGARIFSIGIGDVDIRELKTISNGSDYVYIVTLFSELLWDSFVQPLVSRIRAITSSIVIETTTMTSLEDTELPAGGADIVFILDGSQSVGRSNFKNYFLQFVEDVAESVGLSSQGNRVAVVQFGNRGFTEVDFVENIVSLKQGLSQIYYLMEDTNTTGGLLVANDLWANKGRSHRCAKIGILLMDGICTLDCGRLASAAEDSARSGAHMFSIGIGDEVDIHELKTISNGWDYMHTVRLFSELRGSFVQLIVSDISAIISNIVIETTTTTSLEDSGRIVDWRCDFENDTAPFCDMEQSTMDEFDWSRGTPTDDTGSHGARSGSYYIFIKESGQSSVHRAKIYVPSLGSTGVNCVSYAYSLNGFHTGELHLVVHSGSDDVIEWYEVGPQVSQWYERSQEVTLGHSDQIGFIGILRGAFSGDIAIDNVRVRSGNC